MSHRQRRDEIDKPLQEPDRENLLQPDCADDANDPNSGLQEVSAPFKPSAPSYLEGRLLAHLDTEEKRAAQRQTEKACLSRATFVTPAKISGDQSKAVSGDECVSPQFWREFIGQMPTILAYGLGVAQKIVKQKPHLPAAWNGEASAVELLTACLTKFFVGEYNIKRTRLEHAFMQDDVPKDVAWALFGTSKRGYLMNVAKLKDPYVQNTVSDEQTTEDGESFNLSDKQPTENWKSSSDVESERSVYYRLLSNEAYPLMLAAIDEVAKAGGFEQCTEALQIYQMVHALGEHVEPEYLTAIQRDSGCKPETIQNWLLHPYKLATKIKAFVQYPKGFTTAGDQDFDQLVQIHVDAIQAAVDAEAFDERMKGNPARAYCMLWQHCYLKSQAVLLTVDFILLSKRIPEKLEGKMKNADYVAKRVKNYLHLPAVQRLQEYIDQQCKGDWQLELNSPQWAVRRNHRPPQRGQQ